MSDENRNPSADTIEEINAGANWLANWITDRYNRGYLRDEEYNQAMNRLKNTKVYITDKGYDKFIEALENKELHLSSEIIEKAAAYYDKTHKKSKLSDEEKAMAVLKEQIEKSSKSSTIGFHPRDIQEPVIFLDVNKQRESLGKEINCPTLTSLVVHELTHNLSLKSQEELIDYNISQRKIWDMFGEEKEQESDTLDSVPQPAELPLVKNAEVPKISLTIIPENDKPAYKHTEERAERQDSDTDSKDKYLDSAYEIYARLMQLRYDFGLKPGENFTEEQITEIEKRASEAKRLWQKGQNPNKADVDFSIVKRYKKDMLKDFLNDTAKAELKDEMLKQRCVADYMLAHIEKEQVPSQEKKESEGQQFDPNLFYREHYSRS